VLALGERGTGIHRWRSCPEIAEFHSALAALILNLAISACSDKTSARLLSMKVKSVHFRVERCV